MLPITKENLPSKFFPFLLGHEQCRRTVILDKIDSPSGNWKSKEITDEMSLYAIKKAKKIRNFIEKYGYQDCLAISKMYIRENSNKTLSAVYSNEYLEQLISFTPKQAKGLAELAYATGYANFTKEDFSVVEDEKILIENPRPIYRPQMEVEFGSFILRSLHGGKAIYQATVSMIATAKLKSICNDPDAKKEVEKVERWLTLKIVVWQVIKIALGCLALYGLYIAPPISPLYASEFALLKKGLMPLVGWKILALSSALFTFSVARIANSCGEAGLEYLEKVMEPRFLESK